MLRFGGGGGGGGRGERCGCASKVLKCAYMLALPLLGCEGSIVSGAISIAEDSSYGNALLIGNSLFHSCGGEFVLNNINIPKWVDRGKAVWHALEVFGLLPPLNTISSNAANMLRETIHNFRQTVDDIIPSPRFTDELHNNQHPSTRKLNGISQTSTQRKLFLPIAAIAVSDLVVPLIWYAIENIDALRDCYKDITKECLGHSRLLLQVDNEITIAQTNLIDSYEALVTFIELTFYVFGGPLFFLPLKTDEELELFDSIYKSAVDSSGPMGLLISESEASSLANIRPVSDLVYSKNIKDFVARWNRSHDYYTQGYFQPSDLPSHLNPDMINLTYIQEKAAFLRNATQTALRRGFNDIYDLWLDDRRAFETANSRVDEGVCASVRVQIKQRAVLTRDAFEAELQIQNSGLDMTNITITLSITNRDTFGSSDNLFVLSSPTLVGITGVVGNGTLAGSVSGSASWLILALSNAAPTVPTYYYIGGVFEYYQDGLLTSITMNPDTILVSPDPQLDLLYFHEYDIFADDPFTPPIEPPVPYKLAVLVKNSGYGDAQGLRIMSGQPEIVDNEKGLLVDFKIISAELAGQPVQPSLEVNFGTVPAHSSKVGVWTLTSTLQGTFSNYNATFTYKGPLNDERLALIKSVQVFKLSHCVFIDAAASAQGGGFDDSLPDFLIDKFPDIDRIPDTLISSYQGTEYPVFATIGGTILKSETVVGESFTHRMVVNMSLPYVPLPLESRNGNWFYFRFNDTLPSSYDLHSVLREGGTREVLQGQNVWRTSKIRRLVGVGEVPQRYFHIMDYGPPSGVYELRFVSVGMVLRLTATNITQTSAILSWSTAEQGMYVAVYQKSASEEPEQYNLIETYIRGTSYFVSNLQPATAYSIQVRTASASGGYNSYGSELLLTTLDSFNQTSQPATLAPTAQPTTPPQTTQPTTQNPTLAPTQQPATLAPTMQSTTLVPSLAPTQQPTALAPTQQPTALAPTQQPTALAPTQQPTALAPTQQPTALAPTQQPTALAPTQQPTALAPTQQPSASSSPSKVASLPPSAIPTTSPSVAPSPLSSKAPSASSSPSKVPSASPWTGPSTLPLQSLTPSRSALPSTLPSGSSSQSGSALLSLNPSFSLSPSKNPSRSPSVVLTVALPSFVPSALPSSFPSTAPLTIQPVAPLTIGNTVPPALPTSPAPTQQMRNVFSRRSRQPLAPGTPTLNPAFLAGAIIFPLSGDGGIPPGPTPIPKKKSFFPLSTKAPNAVPSTGAVDSVPSAPPSTLVTGVPSAAPLTITLGIPSATPTSPVVGVPSPSPVLGAEGTAPTRRMKMTATPTTKMTTKPAMEMMSRHHQPRQR